MKKEIILTIDTSSNETVTVGLVIDGKEKTVKKTLDKNKAQVVLPIVEELLHSHDLNMSDLTGIQVDRGPGSFTGLRVGVSIANTLGIFLNIPINSQAVGTIVEPTYS
jgi:tRNA threonylcarbamoyladenosine biosynthesis protein TsaB